MIRIVGAVILLALAIAIAQHEHNAAKPKPLEMAPYCLVPPLGMAALCRDVQRFSAA